MAAATTTNFADVPMPVLAIQVDTWRNTDTRNPAATSAGFEVGESNGTTSPGCPRPLSAAHQLGQQRCNLHTLRRVRCPNSLVVSLKNLS